MKYIKLFELFETGQLIDYEVGDTVVCVEYTGLMSKLPGSIKHVLEIGEEYKVLKIYTLPEDKYLGNKFLRVDVEDLKTGEISKGWKSTAFKSDLEFNADKYNM